MDSDGSRKRPTVEGDSDDKPPEPKVPKVTDCDIKSLESSNTQEESTFVTDAPKDSVPEGPISVETNTIETEKDSDEQTIEEAHN